MTVPETARTWIEGQLGNGFTVYLSTALKHIKITPRHAKRHGLGSLVRVRQQSDGKKVLELVSGKSWNCIGTENGMLVSVTARKE